MLCDYCRHKGKCNKTISCKGHCEDYNSVKISLCVGNIVWIIRAVYDLDKLRTVYEFHKCKIKLVTEDAIIAQCVPSVSFSYRFNLRKLAFGHDFFFTENECRTYCEMLNQYE